MTELKERAFALLNSWTTCDTTILASYLAPGFVEYDESKVEGLIGLNEKLAFFHKLHKDVAVNVLRQITSGDSVCSFWVLSCNVRNPNGVAGKANQPILQAGISWVEFENSKIIKSHIYRDMADYMMQTGYHWSEDSPATVNDKEEQL